VRSVKPVIGAIAAERDARFFGPDDVTGENNFKSTSLITHQVSRTSSDGNTAANSLSATKAYRQADLLSLQYIETRSIIL
jgi:hypothetical protein